MLTNLFTTNKPAIIKDLKSNGLKGYSPNFDCLLSIEDLRDAFKEHLKSEFNLEPFLFIEDVEKLKSMDKSQWKTRCEEIINTYFVSGCQNELNVDFQLKKNMLEYREQITEHSIWDRNETAFDLFKPAYRFILNDLYHDVWPRFIRKKEFLSICIKHYKVPNFIQLAQISKFQLKLDDFDRPYIDDKHFQFFEELLVDSFEWKQLSSWSKTKTNFYTNTRNYVPKNMKIFSECEFFKGETILPYEFERCLVAFETFHAFEQDPIYLKFTMEDLNAQQMELDFNPEANISNRKHLVFETDMQAQLTFQMVQSYSCAYYPEKGIYISVCKPCHNESTKNYLPAEKFKKTRPVKKGGPEVETETQMGYRYAALIYQKMGNFTKRYYFIFANLGDIPNAAVILRKICEGRAEKTAVTLGKLIKNTPEGTTIAGSRDVLKNDPYGILMLEAFGLDVDLND
eukprot:gene12267-5851_t